VIITGRNQTKLDRAGKELSVDTNRFDVTKGEDVTRLAATIQEKYSDLSVLINNAGMGQIYALGENAGAYAIAKEDFENNYFGPVRLTEMLLAILKSQTEAAIVNLSSNVAIHPLVVLPTYSDSKAALHSHSVALRFTLAKDTNIKLHEVLPSLINTPGTQVLGFDNGLPADVAAQNIVDGIEQGDDHIFVGDAGQQLGCFPG
jgi:uncharacterized oxidoreductase